MTLPNKIVLLLLLVLFEFGYSQGGASSCSELEAHYELYQSCATSVPFDNSTNNLSGENFSTTCFEEPFKGPTWFFMKIKTSGDIQLQISQVNNAGAGSSDVDFAIWGPFDNLTNICSQLNIPNEIDCSWLPDSVEIVHLQNAVAGQLYVLLVDNYSNLPGHITITQTGGTGSSDCSFLSSVKILDTTGNEITQTSYCEPATKDLVATIDTTDFPGNVADLRFNYTWYKDGVVVAAMTAATSNTFTLTVSETGTYRVETTAYDGTDPSTDMSLLRVSDDQIVLDFNQTPIITATPVVLEQCDYILPNNDGIATVNLTETYDNFVNGDTTITLKYYYDAALTQPISNPAVFTNTIPFNQDIYVTGTYSTQLFACDSNVGKIALKINPTSVATYTDPAPGCPELNTNSAKFDLDAQRMAIKNNFFPTSNVNIAFYISPADASVEQNELTNDYEFPTGSTTVYTRVETGNSCTGIGTFEVQVYSAPIQTTIALTNACQAETLLLSSKDAEALAGQTASVQASYFYSFEDAKNNTPGINKNAALPLTVGTTPIFVRLFDNTTSCFSIVSFDLKVFANPALTSPDPISVCSTATTAVFDLKIRIPQLTGNNTNYQVSFYENQGDMDSGTPIPTPESYTSASKTVLIKVIDPTNNGCASTSSLTLTIFAIPGNNSNPDPLQICEDSGFYSFDLTSRETSMAGPTALNDIEFRYYIDPSDADNNNSNFIATPGSFTNTVKEYQKIYVRINSKTNSDSETAIACYRILEQELFVYPYPKNNLTGQPYRICVDINGNPVSPALIDTELPQTGYSFVWYNGFNTAGTVITGATGSTLSTTVPGVYSVKITNTTNSSMCTTVANFTTVNSVVPYSIAADPTEQIAFESENTVTAIVTPQSPEFEFMIDNLGWQKSPVFYNVQQGVHTLTVRHAFGCGQISTPFIVVDYPRFFTPNNDGFNDTWNIGGRVSLDISKLYIFDRYGKLLKELNENTGGWDGTFNDQPLPSDDYWFKILFEKDGVNGEFLNHFTLKR